MIRSLLSGALSGLAFVAWLGLMAWLWGGA